MNRFRAEPLARAVRSRAGRIRRCRASAAWKCQAPARSAVRPGARYRARSLSRAQPVGQSRPDRNHVTRIEPRCGARRGSGAARASRLASRSPAGKARVRRTRDLGVAVRSSTTRAPLEPSEATHRAPANRPPRTSPPRVVAPLGPRTSAARVPLPARVPTSKRTGWTRTHDPRPVLGGVALDGVKSAVCSPHRSLGPVPWSVGAAVRCQLGPRPQLLALTTMVSRRAWCLRARHSALSLGRKLPAWRAPRTMLARHAPLAPSDSAYSARYVACGSGCSSARAAGAATSDLQRSGRRRAQMPIQLDGFERVGFAMLAAEQNGRAAWRLRAAPAAVPGRFRGSLSRHSASALARLRGEARAARAVWPGLTRPTGPAGSLARPLQPERSSVAPWHVAQISKSFPLATLPRHERRCSLTARRARSCRIPIVLQAHHSPRAMGSPLRALYRLLGRP